MVISEALMKHPAEILWSPLASKIASMAIYKVLIDPASDERLPRDLSLQELDNEIVHRSNKREDHSGQLRGALTCRRALLVI